MYLANNCALDGETWHWVQSVGLGITPTWVQKSVLPLPSSAAFNKQLGLSVLSSKMGLLITMTAQSCEGI